MSSRSVEDARFVEEAKKRMLAFHQRTEALTAWSTAIDAVRSATRSFARAGAFMLVTVSLGVTSWACGGPVWLLGVWAFCSTWSLVSAVKAFARLVPAHEAEVKANAAYEAVAGKEGRNG